MVLVIHIGGKTMITSGYYLEYNYSWSLNVFHECVCTAQCFPESSVSSSSPGSGPSSPNNGPAGNVTENETSVLPPTPHAEVRHLGFFFFLIKHGIPAMMQ